MARSVTSRRLAAAALLLPFLSGGSPTRASSAPAEKASAGRTRIEVRARAIAPGEAIRVEILSAVPLAGVEGTFLDAPLFFAREQPTRWSAWGVVPLDAKPGPATIALEARPSEPGAAALRASRTIRIVSKRFPVSKLTVSGEFVEPPPEAQKRIAEETARLKAIYQTRTSMPPPTAPFGRPVPGEPLGVFGARRIFNGQPRAPHPGLDLRAAEGTKVFASGPGRVALASNLYFSGNTVILDHGGGFFTLYAHLSKILVEEGETIPQGRLVGLSGATGRVTGPHLHWGAKVGDRPFDPTALLDPRLFVR